MAEEAVIRILEEVMLVYGLDHLEEHLSFLEQNLPGDCVVLDHVKVLTEQCLVPELECLLFGDVGSCSPYAIREDATEDFLVCLEGPEDVGLLRAHLGLSPGPHVHLPLLYCRGSVPLGPKFLVRFRGVGQSLPLLPALLEREEDQS